MDEQLPRLPVRRPVEPLFVLVRAQPGVDARLPAPRRAPRLPPRLRRALRRHAPHAPWLRAARGDVGGGRAALGARDLGRAADRARAGDGARPPERAVDARPPRHGPLRGQRVPHCALGPRGRPRRQARGGDRDGRLGRPGGSGDPAAGGAAPAVPAHAALDRSAPRPSGAAADARALPALPHPPAAVARRGLGARGACPCTRPDPRQATAEADRDGGEAPAAPASPGPGAPPAPHAELPAGLQADRVLERVVSGDPGAERGARGLGGRASSASARSSTATAWSTRSTP